MKNRTLKLILVFLGTIYAATVLLPFGFISARPVKVGAGREVAPAFVGTVAAIGGEKKATITSSKEQSLQNDFKLYNKATKKIHTVSVNELLFGSVASEMSPTVPFEALKAQAVASYSYYTTLKNQRQDKSYHLAYNSKKTGVWNSKNYFEKQWGENAQEYTNIINKAIAETKGQALFYKGKVAKAAFFAASAGQTESAAQLWGQDYPYLISVASPYDSLSSGVETIKKITPEKLKETINTNWPQGKFDFTLPFEKWFSKIDYTIGGSVMSLNICGFSITGSEAYYSFGIASTCFTVEYKDGEFVFKAKGRGEGVGMSQTGAIYMAADGADYTEILSWYFSGTEIKNNY